MDRVLKDLEPKLVLEYFEDLTRIPRGSGNEDQVCDYLIKLAEKNGFSWHKDDMKNLLIRVPATPGYEDHPTVIVQGHTDMVCEKNEDTVHDFEKDPIKMEIEGDKIIAKETTLGADDGIGRLSPEPLRCNYWRRRLCGFGERAFSREGIFENGHEAGGEKMPHSI